ncbi:MAG: EcsC family protein [Desulfobacterales bacterium]|nr:EcsC family protein [Desulfobacterales bacterium]
MLSMTTNDLADLRRAKNLLQKPGLAARMTGLLSIPIAKGFALVPARLSQLAGRITHAAIEKALAAAVVTLRSERPRPAGHRLHTFLVTASGIVAGIFGLPALALELPLSTAIMLRAIAAIARSEGQDPNDPRVRLECVQVFALGGPAPQTPSPESGYFAMRAALARSVSEAARHLAQRGVAAQSTPALLRFVTQVATRFGVVVSDKAVAQALPLVGAAGGGLINYLFMLQFQRSARGHFIVRRLEQQYGEDHVRQQYERV